MDKRDVGAKEVTWSFPLNRPFLKRAYHIFSENMFASACLHCTHTTALFSPALVIALMTATQSGAPLFGL
jgi:hypothetical protein